MSDNKRPAADATRHPAASEQPADNDGLFPVVGIGASAGGIDACIALLHALPADTGMAFVVVLHLSRAHPSMLPEILSRATTLRVAAVSDGCPLEPNCLYVIPADAELRVEDGRLRTHPRAEASGHPSTIDTFFRSLARERGYKAIGIVLSGTSADGTVGLEEIKAVGGLTFAQDATARHDGMPRSAIASGCVDYVLPPDGMAAELGRIAHHPYVAPPAAPARAAFDVGPVLDPLHEATGVAFHQYKPNNLQRVSRGACCFIGSTT